MARDKDSIASSDEHNARGIELADRGWLDEAINEFRKAIDLDPNSSHAYDNLATVYAEKKRFKDALEAYLKALTLEPDSATAHYNLACFLSAHAADFAIAEYQTAIELEPDYPDAHLNLGLTFADADRIEEATRELKVASELAPDDAFPRHELAALSMESGDFRTAITHLKDVVRLEPKNFEAWLDLGICYAQKGFYEEAERAYAAAAELKADDHLLAYNRAALFAQWGKKSEALGHLRQAISIQREEVLAWLKADVMFAALEGDPDFEGLRVG